MKTIYSFLISFLSVLIFSCQHSDDIPEPGPELNIPFKFMEMDKEYYDQGNVYDEMHLAFYADTIMHAITVVHDSTHNSFDRYFFDNAGRLQKILFNNYDPSFTDKDSIMITRPSANVFRFDYSAGGGRTCTVSPVAGGGKQIDMQYPQNSYHKLTTNSDGVLSKEETGWQSGATMSQYISHFEYDANKKLIGKKDTSYNLGTVSVKHLAITKDASSNTALIGFLKKLAGTDMEWAMLVGRDEISPTYFDYQISNFDFISNGTISSYQVQTWNAPDGTNFEPGGSVAYTFPVVYDGSGRITSNKLYEAGQLKEILTIKYFD